MRDLRGRGEGGRDLRGGVVKVEGWELYIIEVSMLGAN